MLPNYRNYIVLSRYARYIPELKRRETWEETVDRYVDNVLSPHIDKLPGEDLHTLREIELAIDRMDVLPSMRGLMTAGPALDRDPGAIYNCAYLPIDHPRSFDEALYLLMLGTGVGFSVERQYINKLPEVPDELTPVDTVIHVQDSKTGWAKAVKKLIGALYSGDIPSWDTSAIRPHGARLKTFGGRASGPQPLLALLQFIVDTFKAAKGRRLNSLECHDIMCKIGECIVSGGVRRSALISLSNLSDERMRHAKDGAWGKLHPHRSLANNSVCYTEKPDFASFLREAHSLYESYSGERGFFSRVAADKQVAKNGRRQTGFQWGTNPCSEIILRPYQFCNLSSVVVRPEDDLDSLLRKVGQAAILGTVQATHTNFRYLRPIWKRNTEEEALLGVSLSGIMDHPVLSSVNDEAKRWLTAMKEKAIETNRQWAAKLGINPAAAVTCVKPEGTLSQATDSASGLHTRYAEYYIRRVQADVSDPLSAFMASRGIPTEVYKAQPNTVVHSFPMAAPEGARVRHDVSALQQLEHWKMMQDYWCEHKPSITVYYKPDEFLAVMQWVWDNFDSVSGVAFLPYDTGTYEQAPYEEISKEQYEQLDRVFPSYIPWEDFIEDEDNTVGSQTLACVGTNCEVV